MNRKIRGLLIITLFMFSILTQFLTIKVPKVESIIVGSDLSIVAENLQPSYGLGAFADGSGDGVVYARGRWYVFYVTGSSMYYKFTRDMGYTWSPSFVAFERLEGETPLNPEEYTVSSGYIWDNWQIVILCSDSNETEAYLGDIWLRRGIPSSSGFIAWGSIATLEQNLAFIEAGDIVFTTNYIYSSFNARTAPWYTELFIHKGDSNGVWTLIKNYAFIFSPQEHGVGMGAWMSVYPDGIIVVDGQSHITYLYYDTYDGSSWSGRTTFASNNRENPCQRFALTWVPYVEGDDGSNATWLTYTQKEDFGGGYNGFTYYYRTSWSNRGQPLTPPASIGDDIQHFTIGYSDNYIFVMAIEVIEEQIVLQRYDRDGNEVDILTLYDFTEDIRNLSMWKEGEDDDGFIGYAWRNGSDPWDLVFHYFDENATIGSFTETNPKPRGFSIPNMEGCGNWVYAGEGKYYEFMLSIEIDDGTMIDEVALQFSDGYHTFEVSYNISSEEYVLEEGEDYIILRSGYPWTNVYDAGASDYYNVSWNILFENSVYDVYDVDVYAQITFEDETYPWEEVVTDYFNIYSLGGESGFDELAGASGKIPGDQQFEIYAGGQYFKADIFDEHFWLGRIDSAKWDVYDYQDETLLNVVGIVDDHWVTSPYLSEYSVRIYDAWTGALDTRIVGTYDALSDDLYYFQTWVHIEDNTTGWTTIKLRSIDRNETTTWNADVCVMRLGYIADFDGVYFDNSTDVFYIGENYDVDTWHNVTFVVDPNSNTWIPYFDGTTLGNTTFSDNYSPNRIELRSMYGTASRDSKFDSILVWRDFAGGTGGTAWSYTYFRNLQHIRMNLGFGTNDEGIYSWDDRDTNNYHGYIELGINVCSRQDVNDWYEQWKVRISISEALMNPGNNWVEVDISWYERGNLIKTDWLFAYYEGYMGNKDYFDLYVDLWFSNINASKTIAGRVNSRFYGITNVAPTWLRVITLGYYQVWADKREDESFSNFEYPLMNTTGSIHPSREIYMMMPWVKVYRDNDFNFQFYVRNHGLDFNSLSPNAEMQGIDEPSKTETVSIAQDQPNLFWQWLGGIRDALNPLFEAFEWGGLSMWSTFVGFLDTVFSFTGNPNAVSDFLTLLGNFWSWFTTGMVWMVDLVTDFFRLGAVTMTTGLELFGVFVTNWISLIQSVTFLLNDGLQSGFNFWVDFQMDTWLQLIAILYVVWLYFLGVYSGWDKVYSHLTFVLNVLSFVFTIFIRIAEFTISIVSLIIESIPVVE